LLLSIFGFAILDSLIHVVVTELEHAINKSSPGVYAIAVIAFKKNIDVRCVCGSALLLITTAVPLP